MKPASRTIVVSIALLLGVSIYLCQSQREAWGKPPESCLLQGDMTARIYDLCFFQFNTDDIAHPGVQSCLEVLSLVPYESLTSDEQCRRKILLKEYRCHLIGNTETHDGKTPFSPKAWLDDCVKDPSREGYFTAGCKYPFTKECVEKVNRMRDNKRSNATQRQPRT